MSPRIQTHGNGTSSNIHGKHWVGKEVPDQKWKVGQVIGRCHISGLRLERKILQ